MFIQQLALTDLRIIKSAQLRPCTGLNLITGPNGAGKTTILESIYLLGRGKSFRHKEAGPFIRQDRTCCRIVAKLVSEKNKTTQLGLERSAGSIRVRQDGVDLKRRSDLLQILPVQLITPQSHELVERGPDSRRKFLDYNMFHVEHLYHDSLFRYYKALKQRNAALKTKDKFLAHSFDAQLSTFGNKITEFRKNYLVALQLKLLQLMAELEVSFEIKLALSQGWDQDSSIIESLHRREGRDLKYGFTSAGIHRGDILVQADGIAAAKRLSRGQQKILVYLLQLAHFEVVKERRGELPIFLIDDVSAELDQTNLKKVMLKISSLGTQVFVTATNHNGSNYSTNNRVFHVEHGTIRAATS